MSFDAGVFLMSPQGGKSPAQASEVACEEPIDRDRSRKLAIVDAPTALDRCRLMVKAALGDPSQHDDRDGGKTRASRAEHQVKNDLPKLLMIEWE